MSRIEQILIDAIEKNKLDVSSLEKITQYLESDDAIRWEIFRQEERHYHKEDIQNEIDYYNDYNDTNYTFTDEEMDLMLEDYEDSLADSDEWAFRLRNVLEKWIEDKENE